MPPTGKEVREALTAEFAFIAIVEPSKVTESYMRVSNLYHREDVVAVQKCGDSWLISLGGAIPDDPRDDIRWLRTDLDKIVAAVKLVLMELRRRRENKAKQAAFLKSLPPE